MGLDDTCGILIGQSSLGTSAAVAHKWSLGFEVCGAVWASGINYLIANAAALDTLAHGFGIRDLGPMGKMKIPRRKAL